MNELARFSRYLELLHKLSTTNHPSLDALFEEYLSTGCEIFAAAAGAISEAAGDAVRTRKTHGAPGHDPHAVRVMQSRATEIVSSGGLYIGAPLYTNGTLYGVIGFWSDDPAAAAALHPQAKEIIELMAKSVGIAVNQRRLTDELAFQASHDALTLLPNRIGLHRRLDDALGQARLQGTGIAVLFLDLDRFKQINDTLGHSAGDRILQQVASRLRNCLGPQDTLARMGGDEFTAVASHVDPAEATQTAGKLLAAVRAPCRVGEQELFVTASIGISLFPRDGDDGDALLRCADQAMYSAKGAGKNAICCYQEDERGWPGVRRLELESDLRRSLERGELRLHYQPVCDVEGGLRGLEALLGWEHPEHGPIPPSRFIPIAEETGMIVGIGCWVLREACRQIARWRQEGYTAVPVAVNVSALQFAEPDFVPAVAAALASAGVPPSLLELELTESAVMRDVPQSARIMQQVRDLGVRISIDDFGTGYSSLSYLRRLPADCLKIDGSFLAGEGRPESTLAVVRAIRVLAHALGLTCTAEGVETPEQLALVREAGCDLVQGHLFGGALVAEAIEPLLRSEGA